MNKLIGATIASLISMQPALATDTNANGNSAATPITIVDTRLPQPFSWNNVPYCANPLTSCQ